MTTVIDQVKHAAYTSVGVNLLVTDAIVGREVRTPKQFTERAAVARSQATEVLTEFRGRTEPFAAKIGQRLPEPVADAIRTGRTAAWDFIGIDAPTADHDSAETEAQPAEAKAPKTKAKKAAAKATKADAEQV